MTRTAVLVSGNGVLLQTILDSMYFGEIPDFELVGVICPVENEFVRRRCKNAGKDLIVVEPADFPTEEYYNQAICNKLKDMDIDLVVLADYAMPLGCIAENYKNRIIGVYPSLIPAFETEADPLAAALERGCKLTGASSYFADSRGGIGAIIGQQGLAINPEDSLEELRHRMTQEAEWSLLAKAVILFCEKRLEIKNGKVIIKE